MRQKEGLSYGVGSGFTAGSEDKVARLSIGAICNPANIGKVETAVQEELERLLKDGITADELDKAKQGLAAIARTIAQQRLLVMGRLERSLRLDQTLAYDAEFDNEARGAHARRRAGRSSQTHRSQATCNRDCRRFCQERRVAEVVSGQ